MISKYSLGLFLVIWSLPVSAQLNVFACVPEWASLVSELDPEARVHVATTAWQDPHYIEARPGLIAALRQADLAVCTGASLEAGWLPSLIRRASNTRIRPGQPGLFYAADQVTLHQPHDHVDRSMGDVHPEGDPHMHLDPDLVPQIMTALAQRMSEIRPDLASRYQRNLVRWQVDWNFKRREWQQAAETLAGQGVIVQHSTYGYLLRWLGINEVADLEPKPGLPPSAGHLSRLLSTPDLESARLILVAYYQEERPARWIQERTGVPVAIMPSTVVPEEGPATLSELIDLLVATLRRAAEGDRDV